MCLCGSVCLKLYVVDMSKRTFRWGCRLAPALLVMFNKLIDWNTTEHHLELYVAEAPKFPIGHCGKSFGECSGRCFCKPCLGDIMGRRAGVNLFLCLWSGENRARASKPVMYLGDVQRHQACSNSKALQHPVIALC